MSRVFDLLSTQAAVLLCVAVGAGLAWLVRRYVLGAQGRIEDGHSLYADGLNYVSGLMGILFGLLLLFTVQHFSDTIGVAKEQAVHYAAAFDGTAAFPSNENAPVRRDLVCLMRSTATDLWDAAERGDLTGDENTNAWTSRALEGIAALPTGGQSETESRVAVQTEYQGGQSAGQELLLNAQGQLPVVAEVVIYTGTLVLAFLLTLSLANRRRVLVVVLFSSTVLTMVVLGALTVFVNPFSKIGPTVEPVALNSTLARLQDVYPGDYWRPCERLAHSEVG